MSDDSARTARRRSALLVKVAAVVSPPVPAYQRRFVRVMRHIDAHLAAPLRLTDLCALASSSPYHFHRQFRALFGVAVGRYIALERLNRALWQLAFRVEIKVVNVALEAAYESPEAFTRAVKRAVGQSPTEFRKSPRWQLWREVYEPARSSRRKAMQHEVQPSVDIVQFPETRLAVLEHRGSHDLLSETIREFIELRKRHGLSPQRSATFNLVYDDPSNTPAEEFRMDLGCSIPNGVVGPLHGLNERCIQEGPCARVRVVGGDAELEAALMFLYGAWLPSSGRELRDFPLFFQRVKMFPDVPPHEAVTDVYLPLRA